uniref:Putative conserved transmembrane protein n=1 Tax=Mycobacterium sp. (strain JLS) TaxID=164757 RepID=A0A5Q5CA09_MYCSJ
MRNRLRVLVFDILSPVAAIAGLLYIGLALGWPLWWVSVCSVLCLLIVQGVIVNVALMRRDGVTVGTDDDGPGLRLAVMGLATVAVVAAVALGYQRWTVPDRAFTADSAEVVRIASSVSEATATFSPQSPTASIDRAAAQMVPERAQAFKDEFAGVAKQLTSKNVSAQASTVSAGVEAIGPQAASVAVVLRGTQSVPGQPVDNAVLALRVTLSKTDGRWMVDDVTPIHAR